MANYADDFDDRGVASGLPSGLTERWATGAAWSTIDLGAGDIALRRVSSSGVGVRSFASLDAINSDANRNNVEVLVRLRGSAFAMTSSGVVLRGSGSAGAEQGYAAYMTMGGDVRFGRYVSGSLSTIATDTAANLSAATFYWLRVRINGTSYAVTHWSGAEGDDPGTPQITGTDSNISGVGWAGLFAFAGSSLKFDWADIAIATNGDVATMSTGGTDATANGVTVTAAASLIAGTATGQVNATASGQTLTAAAALIPGAATGQVNATADGATVTAAAALIAGEASGGSASTAAGVTLTATATIIPGAATGQRNATADGVTLTAAASLQAGTASAEQGGTAPGALIVAGAALIAGAATAANDATAAGVVIEAAAQFLAGAASGQADATAAGALITCQVIMIRGGAFGPNLTPTPGFTAALVQRSFNATIAPAIRTATRRAA